MVMKRFRFLKSPLKPSMAARRALLRWRRARAVAQRGD